MGVARLLRSRLARQERDERRLASHQMVQSQMHEVQILERMHALGTTAQLAGCLRAAEEEFAKNGGLWPSKIKCVREAMFVLRDATICAGGTREPVGIQSAECLLNFALRHTHVRIAVGLLVTGVHERVE